MRQRIPQSWKRIAVLSVTLLAVGFLLRTHISSVSAATLHGPYTTQFPATENPISEGGKWISGKAVGLDWADVRTTTNKAYGTESGTVDYDDSTAILTGTWGPDQTVQATVFAAQGFHGEVELRLRSAISAHVNTGYEVNFSGGYCQVVRWEGALGNFTMLANNTGVSVKNGDTVKATIVGSEITVYINGTQVNHVIDSTFTSGAPGIGFYNAGTSNSPNDQYGFTSFTATDGGTGGSGQAPNPPTNLSLTVS